MKVGQTLYAADFCCETRVKINTWTVSSVKRQPRRGRFKRFFSPRPKRVYVRRTGGWDRWESGRDSFELERWPHRCRYAASERGAWKKVVPLIVKDIQAWEELEAEEKEAGEVEVDTKQALRQLRSNLTIARKKAA